VNDVTEGDEGSVTQEITGHLVSNGKQDRGHAKQMEKTSAVFAQVRKAETNDESENCQQVRK
jgi:hypothetical protein